ncbi:MAG: UbiA family prenyltransferase [Nitrososphaerota archaeon]
MRKAKALLALTRPPNGLMMFLGVLAGHFVSSGRAPEPPSAALAFLTAYCLNGSSMAVNDVIDLDVDRVNAPERPLPSGAVVVREALVLAAALGAVGLWSSLLLGPVTFAIAVAFYAVALAYNVRLKPLGLLGNAAVSSTVAAPFLFGSAMASGSLEAGATALALLAGLSNLGREVVKGIADVEGDRIRGLRTVALSKGERAAALIGASFVLAAVALSPLPYLLGVLGWAYVPVVLVADAGFVWSSASVIRDPSPENARRVKNQYLLWMLVALIAFLLGSLTAPRPG